MNLLHTHAAAAAGGPSPLLATAVVAATLLFVVTAMIWRLKMLSRGTDRQKQTYVRKPSMFTAEERHFLKGLESIGQLNAHIFAKVRLDDIVDIYDFKTSKPAKTVSQELQKHLVDFVLCDGDDLTPICLIVIKRKKRTQRSIKLIQKIGQDAGLPVICAALEGGYDVKALYQQLQTELGMAEGAPEPAVS